MGRRVSGFGIRIFILVVLYFWRHMRYERREGDAGRALVWVYRKRSAQQAPATNLTSEAELEYEEIIVVKHRNLHINLLNSFFKKVIIYLRYR